jgi:hypothetical protein
VHKQSRETCCLLNGKNITLQTLSIVIFANTADVKGNSIMNGITGSLGNESIGALLSYFEHGIDLSQIAGTLMLLAMGAFLCFLLMKLLIMLFKIGLILGGIYVVTLIAASGIPADSIAVTAQVPQNQHTPPAHNISQPSTERSVSSYLNALGQQVYHTLEDLSFDSFSETFEQSLHSMKEKEKGHTF